MNVDFMRKVDFYVGVPLCFLLTWLYRVVCFFAPPVTEKQKNILLIELSEMGSVLLADPAMRKLNYHHANLFFAIFEANKESLYILNTVSENNIFTFKPVSLFSLAMDCVKFVFWTRRNRIDTVIDLELFSRFTSLLSMVSGASNRVGFYPFYNEGLYRGELLTHRVLFNPHIHISKNFMALANALLSDSDEYPYSKTVIRDDEIRLEKVDCSEKQKKTMQDKIRALYKDYSDSCRVVLINPNASDLLPQRRWMPEHFQVVISMLLGAYPDILILITGAMNEREEAEILKQNAADGRCINFAGQCRIDELPVLYSMSTLMLTNDSGPGHFSAVTDMATYVIFGPETPALYGSLGNFTPIYAGMACSPCVNAANHRKSPCADNVCLQVIQPETVFDIIRKTLDK